MTTVINGTSTSASAPAVVGDDGDTGIFYPAANQVAIATGGAQRVLVDSSGLVSISGTGTEVLALSKSGGNNAYLQPVSSSDAGLQVKDSAGSINLTVGTSSKTLALQGGVVSSGTGITFPASQNASSNANTLDDYEEGTWTPTDASGAGLSLTVQQASYIKIGALVYVQFYITYPSNSDSNTAMIGGLPFTAGNGYGMLYGRWQGTTFQARQYQVNAGDTTAILRGNGGSVNVTNANISGEYILVSGCYSTV